MTKYLELGHSAMILRTAVQMSGNPHTHSGKKSESHGDVAKSSSSLNRGGSSLQVNYYLESLPRQTEKSTDRKDSLSEEKEKDVNLKMIFHTQNTKEFFSDYIMKIKITTGHASM